MSCPECEAVNGQVWVGGLPATHDTPAEPAHWRCLHCEAVYYESTLSIKDDYEYEARRDANE